MILTASGPGINGMGFVTTGPVDNEVYGLLDQVMSIQGANDAAYQYYKQTDPTASVFGGQWGTIIGIGIGVILLAMLLRR
jgi:hypothetical protein